MTYIFHLITDDKASTLECDSQAIAGAMLAHFAKVFYADAIAGRPTPQKISIVIKPKEAVKRDKVS